MASFKKEEIGKKIDWQLLRHSFISLYHKLDILEKDIGELIELEYKTYDFDCSVWKDEEAIDKDLREKLKIPSHYATNLNALPDAVAELDVPDGSGAVIVLRHYDHTLKYNNAQYVYAFLDVLAQGARIHLLFGGKLIILVQIDNENTEFDSVQIGCSGVYWNSTERREALNKIWSNNK
jgi:RNAse (barnase) inhibitor barstar